jgi:dTDP-4-dehydrorhamnose 3,5-epimerase-like enzyme
MQCVVGRIQFHFVDSKKKQRKINLNSNSGKILLIPPNIWFSFTSLKRTSILVNMIDKPHSDKEILKTLDINKILNV